MSLTTSLLGSNQGGGKDNDERDDQKSAQEDVSALKAQLDAALTEIEEKSKVIQMLSQRLAVWDVTATRAVELERAHIAELEAQIATGVLLSETEARCIADLIVSHGLLANADGDALSARDKITPFVSPAYANHI